ncbi:MAG: hypothetical protein FJW90_05975 [Actinobacteria bacterium]|nr:hypothetical protein [Actinomycetota bacterium]
MKPKSSRFKPISRRARAVGVGLAVAGLSAGFTACGDDEQDQLNDAIDEAQENVESALDEVDTEELQEQAESVQEQIEDIDTEELQQQAEEAQKQLEEAYGDN